MKGHVRGGDKFYQDSVDALRDVFTRLTLVMDGGPAIRFADPEVLRVLTSSEAYINDDGSNIGYLSPIDADGDGMLTEEELAVLKSITNRKDRNNSVLAGNTVIETFPEFKYFTGLMYVPNGCFRSCVNLREVVLPPLKVMNNNVFHDSGIIRAIIPEGYVTVGNNLCNSAKQCRLIDLPSTVTSIGDSITWNTGNGSVTIICRAAVPPTFGGFGYNAAPAAVYVPDESVDAYKTASNWSSASDVIRPLSQYKNII